MDREEAIRQKREFREEQRAAREAIKEQLENLSEMELRGLILDLIGGSTASKERYINYLLHKYDNETLIRALR